MIHVKALVAAPRHAYSPMWQPIATAPFDRDLELAVIEADDVQALVFPCRRAADGWVSSETNRRADVRPTHWREWRAAAQA
jgi:hypothetical protein